MTTTTDAIDLTPFCSPADGEWTSHLSAPFVARGYRYATDGRILVRVPAPGEPDTPAVPRRPFPPVADFFRDRPAGDPLPWPADGLVPQSEECWDCDGRGAIGREVCRECDGEGRVLNEYDSFGDCPSCDGTGRAGVRDPCANCNGSGWQSVGRRVGRHLINAKLDRLVRSLPVVRYWPGQDPAKPLPFVFDGGEGCVMGRREPDARATGG